MVQILIKSSADTKEWTIVELQGFLESAHDDLAGIHIGDLHYDAKGVPNLIVGHHVLQGKFATLEKPFAVLKKKVVVLDDNVEESTPEKKMRYETTEGSQVTETSYEVEALVKNKVIFKNRPRPIIVKPQPKST